MRFPLGDFEKPAGSRARGAPPVCRLPGKVDSQDLCFLAGTDPRAASSSRHGAVIAPHVGEIVDQ